MNHCKTNPQTQQLNLIYKNITLLCKGKTAAAKLNSNMSSTYPFDLQFQIHFSVWIRRGRGWERGMNWKVEMTCCLSVKRNFRLKNGNTSKIIWWMELSPQNIFFPLMLLDTTLLLSQWLLYGQILWLESTANKICARVTWLGKTATWEISARHTNGICDSVQPSLWKSVLGRTKRRSGWDAECLALPCCLWSAGARQKLLGGTLLLSMEVMNSVFRSKNLISF